MRANKLAAEIESSANYQKNINRELDDTMDEEAKWGLATDPDGKGQPGPAGEGAYANVDSSGKYVPPSRRENKERLPFSKSGKNTKFKSSVKRHLKTYLLLHLYS